MKTTVQMMKGIILTACIIFAAIVLTAPAVHAVTYTYDSLNRLVAVNYENGQNIRYTYDAGGNMLSVRSTEPFSITSPKADQEFAPGNTVTVSWTGGSNGNVRVAARLNGTLVLFDQSGLNANSSVQFSIPADAVGNGLIQITNGGEIQTLNFTAKATDATDSLLVEDMKGTWTVTPAFERRSPLGASVGTCESGWTKFDQTWGPITVPESKRIIFKHYESAINSNQFDLYLVNGSDSSSAGTLLYSVSEPSPCSWSAPVELDISSVTSDTFFIRIVTGYNGY